MVRVCMVIWAWFDFMTIRPYPKEGSLQLLVQESVSELWLLSNSYIRANMHDICV